MNDVDSWAAAHAATVAVRLPTTTAPPTRLPLEPVPAMLASVTKVREWNAEDWVNTVTWIPGPGEPLLVTGGNDDMVRIWDAQTGRLVRALTGLRDIVCSSAYALGPGGQPLLATGDVSGTARIWDPRTGQTLYILTGGSTGHLPLAWGRGDDGELLLAVSRIRTGVRIWAPGMGKPSRTIAEDWPVTSLAWGYKPDGRTLLAIGTNGIARICDPDTGQTVHTLASRSSSSIFSVAWGYRPDGQPLLAATWHDNGTDVCEPEGDRFTETALEPTAASGRVASWAPLRDGRALLATTSRRGLHLWDGLGLRHLHAEELSFEAGYDHLDWMLAPDGRLLLAAAATDGQIHIWDVALDPPVKPTTTPARERVTVRTRRAGRILEQPEDVTPAFHGNHADEYARKVACDVSGDGQILLATTSTSHGDVLIWDLSTGSLLRTLASQSGGESINAVAWGRRSDGRLQLATAGRTVTRVWDPDTGMVVHALAVPRGWSLAWGHESGGRDILATAAVEGAVQIWDPETGQMLRDLSGRSAHSGWTNVAFGQGQGGELLLATGDRDAVRIWDPDTGAVVRSFPAEQRTVHALAWGGMAGERVLLAAGSSNGVIQVWDSSTGELLRTLTGGRRAINDLTWIRQPDRQLLTGADPQMVRVYDLDSGAEVFSMPGSSYENRQTADLVTGPAGDLLLVIVPEPRAAAERRTPVRVWRIAAAQTPPGSGPAGTDGPGDSHRIGELPRWLVRLGEGGLWVPLGLLADLVDLTGTGPLGTLADRRLEVLAAEPGIRRLRDLAAREPAWDPTARVSFAALLTRGLTIPRGYLPPADATPGTLRQALRHAIAGAPADRPAGAAEAPAGAEAPGAAPAAAQWRVPVADLRAAAAGITDQTLTLLQILGPAACAADPLLPARLAHRIPQLPALTARQLRMLDGVGTRRAATGQDLAMGTLRYSPGTAGLARTGPITRLLPTQLALPRDIMTMRRAENQLLYRQHRAAAPPAPEPVTIILDITPPTFGPAGIALRLAAHLITSVLWHHDRSPQLITLADPATITTVRTPADLIRIWADTTLADPAPALAAAVATAASTGTPAVCCTHFHTARAAWTPAPATRLLTAHHSPEQPPPPPVSPWHAHLPPNPTHAQLTAAITALLTPTADGN